ncbi:MAG: hypothetical protein I3J02_01975 [Prevotella sp.]|nr:hypothetical protein [Prevotella sp.]
MKKLFLSISLICVGLITSCVDKNAEVDEDSKPEWLGGSIYEELQNPNQEYLSGTFTTYLRLVDDLGYATTLSRTGSKTVFPANDEAFQRFFQSNSWGVSSYEQLSLAQKKLLLYSSMLDNALLVSMLSNVSSGTSSVSNGLALKHQTSVSVIDTVTHLYGPTQMPKNNEWWTKFYAKGIDVVRDGTRPMMVHFTREQMVNNSITTTGDNSDFQILTGEAYDANESPAYIFNDKIIKKDVTCQNGYIQQLQDVLVPPGNMADVLRSSEETTLFSRMVDYYAAPYFNQTITNQYNDWAIANGAELIDSIFEMRYVSSRSQNATLTQDPDNNTLGNGRYLKYDLGWNQYYPSHANTSSIDYTITDMGALFAPDDDAVKKYFLPGGAGAYLIDIYGTKTNTEANLIENLDSMQSKNPAIITAFIRNLQQSSYVETVPSKFSTIINDASENMGMTMSMLRQTNGKYDIKIANNGVIYVTNQMIAPDEYRAVLAPSSSYPDMYVMNWAVQDRTYLNVDYRYYLLAMSANYAFFIPEDAAFANYYIDPTSLKNANPRALKFYKYVTNEKTGASELRCDVHPYNVTTGVVSSDVIETVRYNNASNAKYTSQLVDILNYHTLLLQDGETIGSNHYYQTKHGGEVYVSGGSEGATVGTSAQIDADAVLTPAKIKVDYTEANGHAYRIDHVIQAPQKSVSRVLQDNSQFSDFYELCSGFAATDVLLKAGISDVVNSFGTREQDQYIVFTSSYGTGTNKVDNACLDENVKMFNTYNYTLYAPDNAAVEIAHQHGLPRWSDIQAELDAYETAEEVPTAVKEAAKLKIKAIRDFCRYHFQSSSLYADKTIEEGTYESLCTNAIGMADPYTISGGDGRITIVDGAGESHTVEAGNGRLINQMARDYWFNAQRTSATAITTSSFCAVHELTTPLYIYKDGTGNPSWDPQVVESNSSSAKRLASTRSRR